MKRWRKCANAGFFGQRRDRFTEYQPQRTLEEKFDLVAQVHQIQGIELKYPTDFKNPGVARDLLAKHQLTLAAVNVDIKDANHFRNGALSARDARARERAVGLIKESMDLAAELGIDLVTTCPLADGYDYPFQVDYRAAWANFIASVDTAAAYRTDVRLCLEYQPHEPHARIMLDTVGKALFVCSEVARPNLGINLDVGHSLAAHETPAEAAALLAAKGRLFYIHTNDNTGDGGDWDMMSGAVHFWHWLELLYTLDRLGYDGWFGADVSPKHMGPADAYKTNSLLLDRMGDWLEAIGADRIGELLRTGADPAAVYECLTGFMVSKPSRGGEE